MTPRSRWGMVALGLLVLATAFPFYWAIVSSLKEGSALYKVDFLPPKPEWGNYTAIFKEQPFGKNILNSLVVAVSVVVISLALSVTASYALGRINFRGRTPLLVRSVVTHVHDPSTACSGENLQVSKFRGRLRLGARESRRIAVSVSMSTATPSACQGAVFRLSFQGRATRG